MPQVKLSTGCDLHFESFGAGEPIVLCAFDWVAIANESQDAFRDALAEYGIVATLGSRLD